MIRIVRYDSSMAMRWDEFVKNSSNGTFLHLRGYMDYHSDRFTDCSLMAFNDKNRLVAMLPANLSGSILYSHQGLTYGGWIVGRRHFASSVMLEVWETAVEWMRCNGVSELIYKTIPHIYHRYPSEDDLYALFRLGAQVEACQVSSAVPLSATWLANENARRQIKIGCNNNLVVSRSDDYASFMSMLSQRLEEKYDTKPVHTLAEIRLLAERFPENITLFMATTASGEPLAGTVVYKTDTVAHTQYIASTERGRNLGAFSAIVAYLLENECEDRDWLDFGVSCEQGGLVLNEGLNRQKYGLGGRPIVYTAYRLKIS